MKAFVLIPFEEQFKDIFKLGIKSPAKNQGVEAYKLDEELFDEGMLEKIYNEIENADFIIADLSVKNPNVFYELGYAHAIGKLCILITQEAENIPFDLKHKRHVVYGNSLSYLGEKMEENIKWAKEKIKDEKENPFSIELHSYGNLEVTKEYAKANIDFKFDIENKFNKVSPEIQAIYLHSARPWEIYQNSKKVPSKKSELKELNYKYQLIPDISKIPKKRWTQIEINASRIMARAWKGEEIRNTYNIEGNVFIELATSKGTFTENLPIKVTIDNLPF